MSGVQPTIIDYQGIKIENTTLDKSVTLTMDGTSQGFILDYDKLTANPKKFTITDNGINFTDNTNNDTTSLERLALVEDLFPAVEIPPNATTLQLNKSLLLNDTTNNVTAKLDLGSTGNLTIDASGNLILNPDGSILTNGKNINSGGGQIQNCNLVNSSNNNDIIIEGQGTGDVILKTGNTNRLTISDTGSWTCQGGMSYDNGTNNLTATTFTGTATRVNVTNDNTGTTMYPVFTIGGGSRVALVDSSTGPLTYNPSTGVMSFPGVPTCTTSATTTNQLVNFNNFLDTAGTWEPTIAGGTTAGSPTYVTRLGRYVAVNKFVCFQGEIEIDSSGGMVGQITISLPFTCNAVTPGVATLGSVDNVNTGIAMVEFSAGINNNGNRIGLGYRASSTSGNYSNFTEAQITNTFRIRFGGSYIAA